jgi:hypothetical protein
MSYAQNERQRTRASGRYSDMNKCQRCNKSVGENYATDPRSNGGLGHVLCTTCCDKGFDMEWPDALRFYGGTA